MKVFETTKDLLDYLTAHVAAYRQSYRMYGNIANAIDITTGVIGSTALLAALPMIPLAIIAVSVIPTIMVVIQNKLKLREKKMVLKLHHRKFKRMLLSCQTSTMTDVITIKIIAKELKFIQHDSEYVEPLERYMKKYRLNGYENAIERD